MFYLLKCFIQMKILLNKDDLNEALYNVNNLGFVPTMGSLHDGHISLIKKSLKKCSKTIVSIFVNPKQFNNKNDYKRYPRNTDLDLHKLKSLKVNFVYLPDKKEIYSQKTEFKFKLAKRDKILCAKFRKGHFEGVIEVMDRLTKIINPKKIYMGEKDFQQLYLVKNFIENKYKIKIISCKTIRNKNNLALSSRNIRLKKAELNKAEKISQNLIHFKKKELKKLYKISIDYLELRNKFNLNISNKLKNSKLFFAYYLDDVRLIDNF